jgi:hypothetical protein
MNSVEIPSWVVRAGVNSPPAGFAESILRFFEKLPERNVLKLKTGRRLLLFPVLRYGVAVLPSMRVSPAVSIVVRPDDDAPATVRSTLEMEAHSDTTAEHYGALGYLNVSVMKWRNEPVAFISAIQARPPFFELQNKEKKNYDPWPEKSIEFIESHLAARGVRRFIIIPYNHPLFEEERVPTHLRDRFYRAAPERTGHQYCRGQITLRHPLRAGPLNRTVLNGYYCRTVRGARRAGKGLRVF